MFHRHENRDPDIIHRVLRLLYTSRQSSFSKTDLERVGVSIGPFDFFDQDFLGDSRKCLFKPFNEQDIKNWEIPVSMAAWESMKQRLNLPDVDPTSQLARNPTPGQIHRGIKDVLAYLNTNFTFRAKGPTRLCTELGWSVVE